MPPNDNIDLISTAIGELRSDSKRHSEANVYILAELRSIAARLDTLTSVETELREYRKTMHDRMNRIHQMMADDDLGISEAKEKIEKLNDRMIAVESGVTLQWKIMAAVGGGIVTLTGWFSGYIPTLLKTLFANQ